VTRRHPRKHERGVAEHRGSVLHRRASRAERKAAAILFAPHDTPARVPLWAAMSHRVGTCDPLTCLLCRRADPPDEKEERK
jgi:hypothetical protein